MKLYHNVTGGNIDVPGHRVEAMSKKGWFPNKKKTVKLKFKPKKHSLDEKQELSNGDL